MIHRESAKPASSSWRLRRLVACNVGEVKANEECQSVCHCDEELLVTAGDKKRLDTRVLLNKTAFDLVLRALAANTRLGAWGTVKLSSPFEALE